MRKLLLFSAGLLGMFCSCTPAEQNGENDVIKTIMERRSIRAYKDTPVDREILQKIAICGINAPNALNQQEWEVRIIDSKEYIDGVTEIFKNAMPEMVARDKNFKNMFRNAPAVIAIAAPEGQFSGINCGLMGENMVLAAKSLGLGTCCIAGPVAFMYSNPDAKAYIDRLNLSEGYKVLYMIAVGYPDETPDAKPRDESKISFVD